MTDDVANNLSNTDNWMRVLLVVVYSLVFVLAAWVLGFTVGLNLLILLFTGEKNDNLAQFGDQISRYLGQIMAFGTLNSDERPFPFGDWPADPVAAPPAAPAPEPAEAAAPAKPAKASKKASKKTAARKKTAKKKVSKKTASKA